MLAHLRHYPLGGFRGAATAGPEAPGKDVFGPSKVWSIHLEIPAREYEALQPRQGGFGFPGGPPKQPAPKDPKDKREGERNLFGTEFLWGQGKLSADGKTWDKIGVRYAGDITYFASAQRLKRPMKIAFDKYGGQAFRASPRPSRPRKRSRQSLLPKQTRRTPTRSATCRMRRPCNVSSRRK